jgi:hypothetical protein
LADEWGQANGKVSLLIRLPPFACPKRYCLRFTPSGFGLYSTAAKSMSRV